MLRVVLDTNVIISAILFGGKPREILSLVGKKNIISVTSAPLIAELLDVLVKKFRFPVAKIRLVEKKIKKLSVLVYPKEHIDRLDDEPDNRVLEAAVEGKCDVIVTGDRELLHLSIYRDIRIVTPEQFLKAV